MKQTIIALSLLAFVGVASAQSNTQIGGANAAAASQSASGAASQSGAGAAAVIEQNFNTPAQQRLDSNTTISTKESSTATLDQNIDYSGKYTVRNVPNIAPPNILPTSPCMGSSSLGIGVSGFGIGGGTSWKDDDCGYRETARVFMQANMPQDGVAVLCASPYAAQAPTCKKLAEQNKPVAAPAKTSDAKETMIRDANERNRTSTTLSKSEYDRQITVALTNGSKAEQCAVYERMGDTILMSRMGCPAMGK